MTGPAADWTGAEPGPAPEGCSGTEGDPIARKRETPMSLTRLPILLPALALALAAGPALASSCAEEIATLEKRLDSAGAAQVTGKAPPGGAPAAHSDKALAQAPGTKPSDPATKPSAGGVTEARTLLAKAKDEEKAGKAEACRDTVLKAKEKAGALP
ncbi:hypothetical protein AwMethylo_23060 [Methylobacterium sp.]|nr:hypothetical protein AwMethylo_23060 [Methylobacterium sp.]